MDHRKSGYPCSKLPNLEDLVVCSLCRFFFFLGRRVVGWAAGGSGRCGLQVLEGGAESDAMGDLGESGHVWYGPWHGLPLKKHNFS